MKNHSSKIKKKSKMRNYITYWYGEVINVFSDDKEACTTDCVAKIGQKVFKAESQDFCRKFTKHIL